MEFLRQYAMSIIFVSILFSLLQNMVHSPMHTALLQFLCGIYFTIILISPLTSRNWKVELNIVQQASEEGPFHAQTGAELAQDAVCELISEKAAAYIMEQAAQHNAELHVSVDVGDDYLPVFAELCGEVSHQVKEELTDIISSDLGIARENQRWTG